MILQFRRYGNADDFLKENEILYLTNFNKNLIAYGALKYASEDNAVFVSVYDGFLPVLAAFIRGGGRMYITHEIGQNTPEIMDFFAESLIRNKIGFSLVQSESDLTDEFVRSYSALTKSSFVPRRELATMTVEKPSSVVLSDGFMRRAEPKDIHTLTCFMLEMHLEATGKAATYDAKRLSVQNHLNYFRIWESDGLAACCLKGKPLGNRCMLISNVFTDQAMRGKGYCSSLVSLFTNESLKNYPFCCLGVDLFNSVSNHVYKKLGYEYTVKMLEGKFFER